MLMSISFGGMSLVSLRRPFAELARMVLGKRDINSIFCMVIFFIVLIVLGAYFSLNTENRFLHSQSEFRFSPENSTRHTEFFVLALC